MYCLGWRPVELIQLIWILERENSKYGRPMNLLTIKESLARHPTGQITDIKKGHWQDNILAKAQIPKRVTDKTPYQVKGYGITLESHILIGRQKTPKHCLSGKNCIKKI